MVLSKWEALQIHLNKREQGSTEVPLFHISLSLSHAVACMQPGPVMNCILAAKDTAADAIQTQGLIFAEVCLDNRPAEDTV